MKKKPKKCSICNLLYKEWGNNAWPVNKGRCCNDCNWMIVIPLRLKQMCEPIERETTDV